MIEMYRSTNVFSKNLCLGFNSLELNFIRTKIDFTVLNHITKVPQQPIQCQLDIQANEKNLEVEIDEKTIKLLERLSLVDLDSIEALKTLKDSIKFANKILNVDTSGVAPLYTVLEKEILRLRADEVTDGNIRENILKNAKIKEEEYFVAPPGNIPLKLEQNKLI